jgi:helicase MOV-10
LEILFEDTSVRKRFMIVRSLQAIVGSSADHALLQPVAPYKGSKRPARAVITHVIPGVSPEALKAVPWVVHLPLAKIPAGLLSALTQHSGSKIIDRIKSTILPQTLDSQTHGQFFKHLIWIEERQLECVVFATSSITSALIVDRC